MGVKKEYLKCYECKKMYQRELISVVSGKNYCPTCAKSVMAEIKNNTALRDLLYEIADYDADALPMMMKNMKDLKIDNNWKTSALVATIKYMKDLDLSIELTPLNIKTMIERYYCDAKKFYEDKLVLDAYPEEKIKKILEKPDTTITLTRSELIKRDLNFKNRMKRLEYGEPIDLNDIPDVDNWIEPEGYREGLIALDNSSEGMGCVDND